MVTKKTEKQSLKGFLKYQIEVEKSIKKLHGDIADKMADIISRNTNAQGVVDKYKVERIVNDYMEAELKKFKKELEQKLKSSISDSSTLGVNAMLSSVESNKKVTSWIYKNMADKVKKNLFTKRGTDGLLLSDRVWKITDDNIYQLKKIVAGDILKGRSADGISRDIRGYLRQPETLRGAVKDALMPGTGVSKSAYKNAVRLARTETTKAYIDGQREVASAMGYKMRWKLNPAHPKTDICDDLDGNIYAPEDFPERPHPNCYDKETEVYTSQGWVTFKGLSGEKILSLNPATHVTEYLPYTDKVEYKYNGKMLHFTNKGFDLMVTPDHRMYVGYKNRAGRKIFKLEPANNVAKRAIFYRGCEWIGTDKKYIQIGKRKEVDYNGMAYCVSLPKNHILLVRRNGKIAWCGNCFCYAETIFPEEN